MRVKSRIYLYKFAFDVSIVYTHVCTKLLITLCKVPALGAIAQNTWKHLEGRCQMHIFLPGGENAITAAALIHLYIYLGVAY